MRSNLKILVAAAATLLVAPQLAMADDVDEQLRLMNERMAQMEEQLQATNDELEASKDRVDTQQDLIEKAGLNREAQSGLSEFLNSTEFGGYVSASYNYNTNSPHNGAMFAGGAGASTVVGPNQGALGITAPYHRSHDSFQFDQFFLSMAKPATPEGRGGFGFDLVWGAAADNQAFLSGEGTGDNSHVFQAYVEYLADVGDGVNIKLGRFSSLFGAESFRDDENWNITRGLVYALQPVNQTGIIASTMFGEGFEFAIGGTNSYNNNNFDADSEKALIGRIGWNGETASVHLNGLYGGDVSDLPIVAAFPFAIGAPPIAGVLPGASGPGKSSDSIALVDVVATWDPSENLSTSVNFDWYGFGNAGGALSGANIWGIATASRYAINETTGISLRHEWLLLEDIRGSSAVVPTGRNDFDLHTITGTVDHSLTDNLTLKGEVRWDVASQQSGPQGTGGTGNFIDGHSFSSRDQILLLAQAIYRF